MACRRDDRGSVRAVGRLIPAMAIRLMAHVGTIACDLPAAAFRLA
jgi:hypothetical protein